MRISTGRFANFWLQRTEENFTSHENSRLFHNSQFPTKHSFSLYFLDFDRLQTSQFLNSRLFSISKMHCFLYFALGSGQVTAARGSRYQLPIPSSGLESPRLSVGEKKGVFYHPVLLRLKEVSYKLRVWREPTLTPHHLVRGGWVRNQDKIPKIFMRTYTGPSIVWIMTYNSLTKAVQTNSQRGWWHLLYSDPHLSYHFNHALPVPKISVSPHQIQGWTYNSTPP